jgi:putative hydrolase of the HAD superfamily
VAERPALAAVVFDAGGTLVRIDFEWMSGMLAGLGHAVAPERLRRGEIAARRVFDVAIVAGRADVGDYFRAILESAAVPAPLAGPALERCRAYETDPGLWTRPVEGARACLDALGALGLRLACVSNSDGRAEAILERCGVRAGLEFVVDSHREGVAKPAPAIFRIALERLGLPAHRVLYVGDLRSADGGGARGAGLHFVLLDPYGDYAGPGEPAVDSIARLPQWVAAHFTPVAGTPPRGGHAPRHPVRWREGS